MTIYDLNEDQLAELKQRYYADKTGRDLSYYELANIDELVSWSEIRDAYEHVDFVPDDFFCSAGEEDIDAEYTFSADISGTPDEIAIQLRLIANDIDNGNFGGLAGGYGASWGLEKI